MDISSVVEKGVGESTDVSKTRMVSGVLAPRQCRKRLLQFVKSSSWNTSGKLLEINSNDMALEITKGLSCRSPAATGHTPRPGQVSLNVILNYSSAPFCSWRLRTSCLLSDQQDCRIRCHMCHWLQASTEVRCDVDTAAQSPCWRKPLTCQHLFMSWATYHFEKRVIRRSHYQHVTWCSDFPHL